MDKNIRDTDASGSLEWFDRSINRGAQREHCIIRLFCHAAPDPSRPHRHCTSRLAVLSLLLALAPARAIGSPEGRPVAAITPAGKLLITDGTVIPLFPRAGKWTELAGNTSDRYESRHFVYMVPGESPAIELFVTQDRKAEPPDGVFEMGLVKGFLSGLASKAGFKINSLVFRDRVLGPAKIKHTLVKLTSDRQTLWVHAYIYPRKPSLTFIAIRAQNGAQADIEKYLAALELK